MKNLNTLTKGDFVRIISKKGYVDCQVADSKIVGEKEGFKMKAFDADKNEYRLSTDDFASLSTDTYTDPDNNVWTTDKENYGK